MPWYGFTKYGVTNLPNAVSPSPIGQIFLYPSSGALNDLGTAYVSGPPVGFLRCDGSDVLIADFQDLYDYFVANSLSFGAAPVNYFKLPNMGGRFLIGLDTADTSIDTIGETGGLSSHTHTALASHTHSTSSHTHSVSAHTHVYGDHTHTLPTHSHSDGTLSVPNSTEPNPLYSGTSYSVAGAVHGHSLSGSSANATGSTSTPKKSTNVERNSTEGITGTAPASTSPVDTVATGPSSPVTLNSSGGMDSIPPYYSAHYIIKV